MLMLQVPTGRKQLTFLQLMGLTAGEMEETVNGKVTRSPRYMNEGRTDEAGGLSRHLNQCLLNESTPLFATQGIS